MGCHTNSQQVKDGGISLCKEKHVPASTSKWALSLTTPARGRQQRVVPGIVFARGPAVAVLILLESNGETYAVLTEQVRVPIGKFMLELPAGMLDDEKGDFVGTAVHEVEEETGIKLNIEDMVDLMTLLDPATGGRMLPSPQDECYDPATLAASSVWDVAKLRARFCVPSTPLEDTQCCDLHAGVRLCVSCSLDDVNLKFYDAVLDSWSDGPHTGSMEETGIERVCCVQSSPVQDPVLIEFLDGVTKLVGDANGETMSQEIRAGSRRRRPCKHATGISTEIWVQQVGKQQAV
ncbi:Nudix hydrolase 14, chloroplastic [Zea mays]|uniref:Nudix hydrolase 14, chloroplastic n=1 Tax=Zea mays TaxID=4577 RepID=A0A3L6E1X5_MAIZE|nr:Nudix hydrolase 14, chloroplastic [Zea mays]